MADFLDFDKVVVAINFVQDLRDLVRDHGGLLAHGDVVRADAERRAVVAAEQCVEHHAHTSRGERIANLLGQDSFSADELIRETSVHDQNISRFFKLTPRDVEMMVKIVQWGRVSAAQIAASLTLGSAQQQLDEPGEAPEIAIGNYLTEMMHLCRRGADVNHLLLMAQEAAFRCARPDNVILALLDSAQTVLRGRFHAGAHGKIAPSIVTVEMARKDSPLVQCLLSRTGWRGPVSPDVWGKELLVETRARHALIAPILAHDRPIGLQLLTRSEDDPFSKQEQAWLEAIAGSLGVGFERQR
jgi:GAF domain-containing protein